MLRKIIKDMVETMPEEKLKNLFEMITNIIDENNSDEAWSVWEEFGENAAKGKWKDASEKHDFYLYGIKK